VQEPALALVEPHQVPLCPAFQPFQVTLNGSTAFWCIYHSSQLMSPFYMGRNRGTTEQSGSLCDTDCVGARI